METINIRLTGSRDLVDLFVDHLQRKDVEGELEVIMISAVHNCPNSQIRRYFEIELSDLDDLLTNTVGHGVQKEECKLKC